MPSDIYESLYTHFMVYKCQGLTSFTIDVTNKRLISRKTHMLFQACVILFVTSWVIFRWLKGSNASEADLLNKLFHDTGRNFTMMGMCVLFTTALFCRWQLSKIFDQINTFDRRLSQALQKKLYYKKRPVKYIFVRVVLFSVLVVVDALNLQRKIHDISLLIEYISYYLLYVMMLTSSSLYCCFILECQRRIKFANDYMEKMFFGNRFVVCIEMKLTPVANVCYSLEDIKTELSALIDTVEDINRYFEIQLFVKAANMFQGVLWAAYYFIVSSGKEFDFLLSLQSEYSITNWCFICIVDFCIDVYIYQRLLAEVCENNLWHFCLFKVLLFKIKTSQELLCQSQKQFGKWMGYYKQVTYFKLTLVS